MPLDSGLILFIRRLYTNCVLFMLGEMELFFYLLGLLFIYSMSSIYRFRYLFIMDIIRIEPALRYIVNKDKIRQV
jgi:hypothetical protein